MVTTASEIYWSQRWAFLEDAGYRLRPKFSPNFNSKELNERTRAEYDARYLNPAIMDAQRISDGQKVMLKSVSTRFHPDEVRIARLFSSPPHAGNPRNHCIPILEVLRDPETEDTQILVMPLMVTCRVPVFDTLGEVIDCFRQVFEGIQYMHENFVAHRDCSLPNILQDPTRLFPHGFHPVRPRWDYNWENLAHPITRTQCWPSYYIIDFGLSRQYDPAHGLPFEPVIRGGDKSPPEHDRAEHDRVNPFPTDIYFLGNSLKNEFLYSMHPDEPWDYRLRRRWRFLEPLVEDMIHPDPTQRPTIGQVIQRFNDLCGRLSKWHLRRPGQQCGVFDLPAHRWRQLMRAIRCVPAVPAYMPPSCELSGRMRAFYTQTVVEHG
ncbi:kinase domain-containing protein, partial [Favolaschia claudopus]